MPGVISGEPGATMLEYVLICGFIFLMGVVGVVFIGQETRDLFHKDEVVTALGGRP